CAAGQGCGAGWLLRCFGTRAGETLVLDNSGGHAAGDRVVLSIPERWLLLAAGVVYGAPLLGLLVGAALGDLVGQDAGAMLLGAAGFVLGAVFARVLNAWLAKACPLALRARTSKRNRAPLLS
ncbi:MAG: SoxR reducing system RseC family protein, partial [Gammaproteobacteria bacterium]|nr:SoxR reducing system RseC family protein [Gammaproteobacteria bacterium]